MKRIIWALAVLFVGGSLIVSQASAFSLSGGYLGPLEIKFTDFGIGTVGWQFPQGQYGNADGIEDSWGILKVATMKTPAAQTVWWDGKDGEELTGIYYGIDDDYWTFTVPPGVNVQSVGGMIDIYLDNTPDFNPTLGPGARMGVNAYPTVTDGVLFLRLALIPGIKFGDGNPANDHITYDGNLDNTTSPWTGDSAFYLKVVGGAYAPMFASNMYKLVDDNGNISFADFFTQSDLVAPGYFGWMYNSEDPVRGAAVPAPATMLLFGSGLMGLVGFGRMKFFRK